MNARNLGSYLNDFVSVVGVHALTVVFAGYLCITALPNKQDA